jgi:8-oxo-dGTP diphosphatase
MQNIPTCIWVVAAALVTADRRVLMQKRGLDRSHGGLWEFPGGKLEAAETLESAIFREIREELGVELDSAALQPVSFAADRASPSGPRQPHVILLYSCRRWQGEPRCLDAQEIGWFAPQDLQQLAMPPLDYPLAAALQKVI